MCCSKTPQGKPLGRLEAILPTRSGRLLPSRYEHPITKQETMVFHCGAPFCRAFVMDMGKDSQKVTESARAHSYFLS